MADEDYPISISIQETRTLELSETQVADIIRDWAKQHGFSHRADVSFDCPTSLLVTIQETISKSY